MKSMSTMDTTLARKLAYQAADRQTWLETINAPGRKGHGSIDDDVLTLQSAECTKQNFDLLVANPHMQEIFKNLQIQKFIYTNDLDLTFTQEISSTRYANPYPELFKRRKENTI